MAWLALPTDAARPVSMAVVVAAMIDDQDGQRAFLQIRLQPELLLQRILLFTFLPGWT